MKCVCIVSQHWQPSSDSSEQRYQLNANVFIFTESIYACDPPPQVPHAVIIHQEFQELFAEDSEVQYQCEDGYTTEEGNKNKYIYCIAGNWTEEPTCSKWTVWCNML